MEFNKRGRLFEGTSGHCSEGFFSPLKNKRGENKLSSLYLSCTFTRVLSYPSVCAFTSVQKVNPLPLLETSAWWREAGGGERRENAPGTLTLTLGEREIER